jgi:hypothetical protein
MARARRHRLTTLAGRECGPRPVREMRSRDDGFSVHASGAMNGNFAVNRPSPSGRTLSADWGWPVAEPSSLTWPDSSAAHAFGSTRVDRFLPLSASEPPPRTSPQPWAPLDENEADAEVRAILSQKGMRPAEPALAPAKPPVQEARPSEAPAEPVPPQPDPHAIFKTMGRPMAHANSFNLGRFDLDRHFRMLEDSLSLEGPPPRTDRPARADPRRLDDTDVAGELALINEAAGIPPREAPEEPDSFLKRAAEAQSVRLSELEAACADSEDASPQNEQDEDEDLETMPSMAEAEEGQEQDDG